MTGTIEEMASELQRKFEVLVTDDKEIYEKACKGNVIFTFIYSVLFQSEMSIKVCSGSFTYRVLKLNNSY